MPAALLILLISPLIQAWAPADENDERVQAAADAVYDAEESCDKIRSEKKVDPKIKSQKYRNCLNQVDQLKKEFEKLMDAYEPNAKTTAKTTARRKTT